MQFIGKLDRKLYSCVADEIVTDDVIITDERIKHIIERRGKVFYDEYSDYFADIVSDPDYIFEDKRAHTAIVCKSVASKDGIVNIVIRLAVESDPKGMKNSIITAIREGNKRFAQRVRNNRILYKKSIDEDV